MLKRSLRDDVLLIDLGGLREMTFDPATGIATASPGLTGGAEFTPFLTERGRVFTGGHCPSVGLGGFLLLALQSEGVMEGRPGRQARTWRPAHR